MPDYGPGGSLFVNDRKQKPNQPDYTGYVEFDRETIESLVSQLRAGETPKADLSGWKKTSKKTGKGFLSLSAKPPFKRDNERSGGNDRGSSGGRGGFDDFGGGQQRGGRGGFDDDAIPF